MLSMSLDSPILIKNINKVAKKNKRFDNIFYVLRMSISLLHFSLYFYRFHINHLASETVS